MGIRKKLTGVLMKADTVTKNGRVYPREVLAREIARMNDVMQSGRMYGTFAEDSTDGIIRFNRVSHRVMDMRLEGDDVQVDIEVLDTPMGDELKLLLRGGRIRFGLSGSASVRKEGDVEVVQDDFRLRSVSCSLDEPEEVQSIKEEGEER